MNNKRYLCSTTCGIKNTARLGEALDRAPRPYTAPELAEITKIPLVTVTAFLKRNRTWNMVNSRYIPRTVAGLPPGKQMLEYWRGQSTVAFTFQCDNMMDDRTEGRLREGRRPVSWRDGNNASWSIDEADNVAAMRGSAVVRLGKLDNVSFSQQGVTVSVRDGTAITFRRSQT